MHYPSDVLAGAALGLCIGSLVPGLGAPPTEERLFDLAVGANERAQASQARRGGDGGAAAPAAERPGRGVKIGIVGLPNAGKSTLFNALTRAGAETGDYAFTTIDPNVAVVAVPDERLERVAETVGSSEVVLETIEFHDIAGLVRGASQGEGLGNQFLAAIRETDAICHVVRCHSSGGVPHPEGRVDPRRRHRADRDRAARRRPRAGRAPARAGDQAGPLAATRRRSPSGTGSSRWSRRSAPGRPVREVPVPEAAADAPRRLFALTSKPILYVANVDEGVDEVPDGGRGARRAAPAPARSRSRPGSRPSSASSTTRPRPPRCAPSSGSPSPASRG